MKTIFGDHWLCHGKCEQESYLSERNVFLINPLISMQRNIHGAIHTANHTKLIFRGVLFPSLAKHIHLP